MALLISGAKEFIHDIEGNSQILSISALLLAQLIIPIATEFPEKVNTFHGFGFVIRLCKDTLVFGNITVAMVFKGTLLLTIGVMLPPW